MLIRREPFFDFFRMQEDDLWSRPRAFAQAALSDVETNNDVRAFTYEAFEQDGETTLEIEVPGVKPEDLVIEVEGRTLTVEGRRERRSAAPKDGTSVVTFRRVFTLPEHIDTARVDAQLADGLLSVVLPKQEKAAARKVIVRSGESTTTNQ